MKNSVYTESDGTRQAEENELARSLLSKSLEPQTNRAELLSIEKGRFQNAQEREVTAAYRDDWDTSQSSVNNYMSRTTNPNRASNNLVNLLNVVSADTEPATSTYKAGCRSHHNYSVGPNDDTTSQISSCRQRRAQYHRLLTAGKIDELERQISIEIQSNN